MIIFATRAGVIQYHRSYQMFMIKNNQLIQRLTFES
jgi:hypothetical protein